MEKFYPKKPEKEVISIRIDTELIRKVDSESAKVGISRNEFINQCILYAMDNLSNDRDT